MYIVFEGIDQCGKSTQIKKLLERLDPIDKKYILLREPGGTPLSEQIREILLHKKDLNINPNADMLLFFASRAQLQDPITQGIENEEVVISDRSFYSTIAYQGYGRGVSLDKINKLVEISECRLPEIVILLDIPITEMVERKQKMAGEKDRFESLNTDFFEKARTGYLETAKSQPERFIVVDGTKTMEEIHNQIWEAVSKKLDF
jgi:dTMP kinase